MLRQSSKLSRLSLKYLLSLRRQVVTVKVSQLIKLNRVNLIVYAFQHEASQALIPVKAYTNGKRRN